MENKVNKCVVCAATAGIICCELTYTGAYGCWGGTTQNLGRIVPEFGADRPPLGRTWGGSTRGGSTLGRIDRYPVTLMSTAVPHFILPHITRCPALSFPLCKLLPRFLPDVTPAFRTSAFPLFTHSVAAQPSEQSDPIWFIATSEPHSSQKKFAHHLECCPNLDS